MLSNQNTSTNIRSAELLATIVAGFAVEQIAQGTIARVYSLYKTSGETNILKHVLIILAGLSLIINTIRIFHGNSIYLDTKYRLWNHKEVPEGMLTTTPIRYFFDIIMIIVEYSSIVGISYFITMPISQIKNDKLVMGDGLFPLGIAILSLYTIRILSKSITNLKPKAVTTLQKTLKAWLKIDIISSLLIALILLLYYLGQTNHINLKLGDSWIYAVIPFIVVGAATAIDYVWNSEFYWKNHSEDQYINTTQAMKTIIVLLNMSESLRQTNTSQDTYKSKLENSIKAIFQPIMSKEMFKLREALFARKKLTTPPLLNIGIYFLNNHKLTPIFRWADEGIRLKNREFIMGSDFIGNMFVKLLKEPSTGIVFSNSGKVEDQPFNTDTTFNDEDRSKYKSSIVSNIFWPPSATDEEREAIGILTITSSETDYFTDDLHGAFAVAIAQHISFALENTFGPIDKNQLTQNLQTIHCENNGPITIRDERDENQNNNTKNIRNLAKNKIQQQP